MKVKMFKIFHSNKLEKIENKCQNDGINISKTFNELPDELWSKILFDCPARYPKIKNTLPQMVKENLQIKWVGRSGSKLRNDSLLIYQILKKYYKKYSNKDLTQSKILDFGCGWGRITRFFLKDVDSSKLFGVDPDPNIIEICKEINLGINLSVSDRIPNDLPFDEKFDMIYAFSVFTHLSENTHEKCLEILHQKLEKDGVLITTIRPRNYLKFRFSKKKNYEELLDKFNSNSYVFVPHNIESFDEELTYGDSVIPLKYVEKNWSKLFNIREYYTDPSDWSQIFIVLQKL